MSGPAITQHAAQNAHAAGLIATKFIKPSHATGQTAFDAVLQKLATHDSQPQTGDDVKSDAEDVAKSDATKEESAQDRTGSGDLQVAPDSDPAAAIATLVAPQSTVDASTATIAALLASPTQIDANASTVRQASQAATTGVNIQAFGAKASTSATQAWAARLQAQSQIGDHGGAVMPSDSTTQIAATATPTVAPAVVDVHVQSARTFLGLDNSAQVAKVDADYNASTAVDPTNGAKAAITAEVGAKQDALSAAAVSAAASVTPSSAANAETSAAKQNAPSAAAALGAATSAASSGAAPASGAATSVALSAAAAAPGAAASPAPNAAIPVPVDASTTLALFGATASNAATAASNDPAGAAATQAGSSVSINSDPGGAVRVPSKAGALNETAAGSKAGPSIPASAPAGSNAGQQAGGGSMQHSTSNGSRGAGASSNNAARTDGAISPSASGSVGASATAGVAAVTAMTVGPLTVDQLPDFIANQAATLASSAPTPVSSGATAANLNPVKELNVQLNPADLGSLTVKMRIANGSLAVVIEASKDSTAKMIADERGVIAERLASGDQPLASVTVQASSGVPYQGDNSNGSSATPQQGNAQGSAANSFNSADGQARSSHGDDSGSQAGQANSTDDQTSSRSLTGDLFV